MLQSVLDGVWWEILFWVGIGLKRDRFVSMMGWKFDVFEVWLYEFRNNPVGAGAFDSPEGLGFDFASVKRDVVGAVPYISFRETPNFIPRFDSTVRKLTFSAENLG